MGATGTILIIISHLVTRHSRLQVGTGTVWPRVATKFVVCRRSNFSPVDDSNTVLANINIVMVRAYVRPLSDLISSTLRLILYFDHVLDDISATPSHDIRLARTQTHGF